MHYDVSEISLQQNFILSVGIAESCNGPTVIGSFYLIIIRLKAGDLPKGPCFLLYQALIEVSVIASKSIKQVRIVFF